MKKIIAITLILGLFAGASAAFADEALPFKRGGASLLIPGLGQYYNQEHHTTWGKTKIVLMGAIEIGAIITTAVVGGTVGAPAVWVGIGLFIGNHIWSAGDAFINAKEGPGVSMEATGAR